MCRRASVDPTPAEPSQACLLGMSRLSRRPPLTVTERDFDMERCTVTVSSDTAGLPPVCAAVLAHVRACADVERRYGAPIRGTRYVSRIAYRHSDRIADTRYVSALRNATSDAAHHLDPKPHHLDQPHPGILMP